MFWLRSRYHPIEREVTQHSGRAVAYFLLLAVLLGFYAFSIGCTEDHSPTAQPIAPPVVLATPTPAPTPSPTIAATPAPATGHDWWIRADGTFYVQNLTGGTTSYQACARKVYPGGEQSYTSADSKVVSGLVPPEEIWRGQLSVAACYMELELLESPNTCEDFAQVVGARYINVGLYCSKGPTPTPTPTTTPSPTPSPTPSASPTPAPSPTPCAPEPRVLSQSVAGSPAAFAGHASVTGSGTWALSIYATSDLSEYEANQPDYVKDTDRAATACGASAALEVSYGWQGHPSRYWWGDLKLNGSRIWKSAVVEHAP